MFSRLLLMFEFGLESGSLCIFSKQRGSSSNVEASDTTDSCSKAGKCIDRRIWNSNKYSIDDLPLEARFDNRAIEPVATCRKCDPLSSRIAIRTFSRKLAVWCDANDDVCEKDPPIPSRNKPDRPDCSNDEPWPIPADNIDRKRPDDESKWSDIIRTRECPFETPLRFFSLPNWRWKTNRVRIRRRLSKIEYLENMCPLERDRVGISIRSNTIDAKSSFSSICVI